MTTLHEVLVVETGGPGAGLLLPGRIQRALALGAGVRAEEIGAMTPLARGRVAVEIAVERAMRIATPRLLPIDEAHRPTLLVVRRDDDPPEEGSFELYVRWEGGDAPEPGALVSAFAAASDGRLGAEEVGVGFEGPGWIRVTLPERMAVGRGWPAELTVDGRTLTIDPGYGGKKNS